MSSVAPDGRRSELRGAWIETPAQLKRKRRLAAREERSRRSSRTRVSPLSFLFIVTVVASLVGLAIAMQASTYDFWGGLLIAPILLVLTLPLASRVARDEGDPRAGRIVLAGVLVKLALGTPARYVQALYVYKNSDASSYYNEGALLIDQLRHLDFSHLGAFAGTRSIEIFTGMVLAVIDLTRFGAFIAFSWLGFVGLYLFYRAFRLAFPEGNYRRYRLLLFFWPSLVFWPSSIGKDAVMVLALGACALGVANLLVGRARGLMWLGVGALASAVVRPHLTILVFVGFAVALVLRRNGAEYARLLARPAGTALLMIGLVIAGSVLFAQAQSFFKLDSLDVESAQLLLQSTSEQTSEGGTSFTPADPTTPIGFIEGTVTVLFRPLPNESSGLVAIAGLEGLALVVLVGASLPRIARIPRMTLRNPYVAFSIVYCFAFVFAFSSISNFGILARERTQLFPLLFVLLALPRASEEKATEQQTSLVPIAAA